MSVADFEKDHAMPGEPTAQDSKRKRNDQGEEEVAAKPREKPQCGPGATREWPEDDMHVCEEDHRCCDVAKFYGVDLELLVEKNKVRYKSLNKVIRLKAGTVLLLPLPGDTKESIAAEEAQEKERLKKKRRLELQQQNKAGEAGGSKDKKPNAGKVRAKGNQKNIAPVEEEPEESVESMLARASDADTPQACGARQVSITDRLPFNVTRPEIEPHKWDEYRDSTLAAKSFEDLGAQLSFMEAQILPAALQAEWVEKHRDAFAGKCAEAKDVTAIQQCMRELFLDAIDWAAVDQHWDMIEDEEANATLHEDDMEAPAKLAKTLTYESEALKVYVEDEKLVGGKRFGRLYIGRHPKTGAPMWLVETTAGGGTDKEEKQQQLKASLFAQSGGASGGKQATSHFLRKIHLVGNDEGAHSKQGGAAMCLLDWLVAQGHISKAAAEVGQKGSLTALAAIPATVEEKLAQAMARMLQLVDRIPFAAVKNKKADLWVEYSHRIVEASNPGMLAVELKWFSNQLVTKVMQAPWLSNARGAWEVSCDRVSALKDFYMVLMELEDDAINWKAIDLRWALENSRASQDTESTAPAPQQRSHKKREKRDKQEGPCPLPLPTSSASARLPEGWGIEVKSATVWRPEECYVVFKAPDGYHLHSIDDVLKYYQKHKMLQQFSESIRKGFVAAQQEAKTVHSKHMQKIAKFLFPMPEIPAKFLDDAKDTDISRGMRMQERTARLAEKVANSPKPVGVIPTSAQGPVALDKSSAATAATSMSATLEAAAVVNAAVARDGGQATVAQTATATPSAPAAAACTAATQDVSGAAASASDLCCSQHGSAPGSLTEGSFAGANHTEGAAPLSGTGAQSGAGAGAGAIPVDSGQVVVASGSSCLGRSANSASDGDGDSAGNSQNAGEAGGEEVGRKRAREEGSGECMEKVAAHDVGSTCHESPSEAE